MAEDTGLNAEVEAAERVKIEGLVRAEIAREQQAATEAEVQRRVAERLRGTLGQAITTEAEKKAKGGKK